MQRLLQFTALVLITSCILPKAQGSGPVLFTPVEKILMRDVADFLNHPEDFESRDDWLKYLKTAFPSGTDQKEIFAKLSVMFGKNTLNARRRVVLATSDESISLDFDRIFFRGDRGYLGDPEIGNPHFLRTGITFYFNEDGTLIKASSNAMTLGDLLEITRPELNQLEPPPHVVTRPTSDPEKK